MQQQGGWGKLFLSTPSARRATILPRLQRHPTAISIHALREEGDCRFITCSTSAKLFLSTPSARRATLGDRCQHLMLGISIHALREEGDAGSSPVRPRQNYFYPRPPRGGRPEQLLQHPAGSHYFYPRPPRGGRRVSSRSWTGTLTFLSTPSARRATRGISSAPI